MSDINKKILPVQDELVNILNTTTHPIVEGKFLYAYDKKLSFFDRGGRRLLKITTNSSELPLTQEEILETDFNKLKGSLNVFKTESGLSMYYTDASGETFEITQGSGGSSPVVLNHNNMPGRSEEHAHPISSITDLATTLDEIDDALAEKVNRNGGTLINPRIGEGSPTWTISDTTDEQLRFTYSGAGTAILPKVELETKTIAFAEDVQSAIALKVNISDIVNNLTSTDTNKPLSANQGKVLNDTTAKLAVSNVFTQPQIVPNAENDDEAVNLGQLNTVVSIWRYE